MKALVTGAAGNIGSRLVPTLVTRGHEVRAVVRPGGRHPFGGLDVEVVGADVMDRESLSGIAEGMDVVFHLVGYLFAPRRQMVETMNLAAARNVAEVCLQAGVPRIIFTSSILVYGPNAELPCREDHPRQPNTAYSRAKMAVEDYLLSLADQGLSPTIMRVGHVYGPDVSSVEEFKRLIAKGLYRLAGHGDHLIPPIHVDDLAVALALAGENDRAADEVLNVNDDQPVPLREFSTLIAAHLGKPPVKGAPLWVFQAAASLLELGALVTGRRPFFDRDTVTLMQTPHWGDNAKIKQILGWQPRYPSVHQGIATCFPS